MNTQQFRIGVNEGAGSDIDLRRSDVGSVMIPIIDIKFYYRTNYTFIRYHRIIPTGVGDVLEVVASVQVLAHLSGAKTKVTCGCVSIVPLAYRRPGPMAHIFPREG